MMTIFWLLFAALLALALVSRRPWAAVGGMIVGTALVLTGLAAAVPTRTLVLALLAPGALALLRARFDLYRRGGEGRK